MKVIKGLVILAVAGFLATACGDRTIATQRVQAVSDSNLIRLAPVQSTSVVEIPIGVATATVGAKRLNPPAKQPAVDLVAQFELDNTYNARQCIIDEESRQSGVYFAENPRSTASGAYQWLNSSWQLFLPLAEAQYGYVLTSPVEDIFGARLHAATASPYAQDLVSAFALIHRPQNARPWPYRWCWNLVGTEKLLRLDGPENFPTEYIQLQIEALQGSYPR